MTRSKYQFKDVYDRALDRAEELWELSEAARPIGRTWYFEAHHWARRMAQRHSLDTAQVAGMMAVLSPQIDWVDAQIDTIKVLNQDSGGYYALPVNIDKAKQIRDGNHIGNVAGGKKVQRFYLNIAYPSTTRYITLDSHMARMFGYEPAEVFQLKNVYEGVEKAIQEQANRVNEYGHAVQATLWLAFKGSKRALVEEEIEVI